MLVCIVRSVFLQPRPQAGPHPSFRPLRRVQVNLRHGSHGGPWASYTFVFGLIFIKLYNP